MCRPLSATCQKGRPAPNERDRRVSKRAGTRALNLAHARVVGRAERRARSARVLRKILKRTHALLRERTPFFESAVRSHSKRWELSRFFLERWRDMRASRPRRVYQRRFSLSRVAFKRRTRGSVGPLEERKLLEGSAHAVALGRGFPIGEVEDARPARLREWKKRLTSSLEERAHARHGGKFSRVPRDDATRDRLYSRTPRTRTSSRACARLKNSSQLSLSLSV